MLNLFGVSVILLWIKLFSDKSGCSLHIVSALILIKQFNSKGIWQGHHLHLLLPLGTNKGQTVIMPISMCHPQSLTLLTCYPEELHWEEDMSSPFLKVNFSYFNNLIISTKTRKKKLLFSSYIKEWQQYTSF